MREFSVFLCISLYSVFEIVYVDNFSIIRWSFVFLVSFSNLYFCFKLWAAYLHMLAYVTYTLDGF